MPNIYRQGDIMLIQVNGLPEGAEQIVDPLEPNNVVLAYGEATTHKHQISSEFATMYRWEGDTLINVKEGAQLVHEEHATITLPAGNYTVRRQNEYAPGAIVNVAD